MYYEYIESEKTQRYLGTVQPDDTTVRDLPRKYPYLYVNLLGIRPKSSFGALLDLILSSIEIPEGTSKVRTQI